MVANTTLPSSLTTSTAPLLMKNIWRTRETSVCVDLVYQFSATYDLTSLPMSPFLTMYSLLRKSLGLMDRASNLVNPISVFWKSGTCRKKRKNIHLIMYVKCLYTCALGVYIPGQWCPYKDWERCLPVEIWACPETRIQNWHPCSSASCTHSSWGERERGRGENLYIALVYIGVSLDHSFL